jgi:hypothetical protein
MKSGNYRNRIKGAACRTTSVTIRALCLLACLSLLGGVLLTEAHAEGLEARRVPIGIGHFGLPQSPIANYTMLAEAPTDACFYGLGVNVTADDFSPATAADCSPAGQPKVNQAYVWGLTTTATDLWFGTMSNTLCYVQGALLAVGGGIPALSKAYITPDNAWACEFGENAWDSVYGGSAANGIADVRPPRIYWYNSTDGLNDVTPAAGGGVADWQPPDPPATTPNASPSLTFGTMGLRFATFLPQSLVPGATVDMVMLGGPSLSSAKGISMFVFNADTRAFIGYFNLPNYSDVRFSTVVQGTTSSVAYIAVGNSASNPYIGSPSYAGGSVLAVTGVTDYTNCPGCPAFTTVGLLPSEGAYIVPHQGHLFVTTWPSVVKGNYVTSGLFMSPAVSSSTGALTVSGTAWAKVWLATDYEPDPAVATTYAGGALASFNGQLYWGTMHVPLLSTLTAVKTYKLTGSGTGAEEAFVATQRATAIFRCLCTSAQHPSIELLYGQFVLPKYNTRTKSWGLAPNNMWAFPRFGSSGINNPYNTYTWSMAVWENKLWIGTFNWAYVLNEIAPTVETAMGLKSGSINLSELGVGTLYPFGANLAYMSSAYSPARFDDNHGLGNFLNYGFRNLLPVGDTMYVGTANAMSLKTDPTKPMGGWELLQLQLK